MTRDEIVNAIKARIKNYTEFRDKLASGQVPEWTEGLTDEEIKSEVASYQSKISELTNLIGYIEWYESAKNILYDEEGRKYKLIQGKIPADYSIWNAWCLRVDGHTYLKLYCTHSVKNFIVDVNTLLALEVSEPVGRIIERACNPGGRNPDEVLKALKSKDEYQREKANIMKPYIEELYGISFNFEEA